MEEGFLESIWEDVSDIRFLPAWDIINEVFVLLNDKAKENVVKIGFNVYPLGIGRELIEVQMFTTNLATQIHFGVNLNGELYYRMGKMTRDAMIEPQDLAVRINTNFLPRDQSSPFWSIVA